MSYPAKRIRTTFVQSGGGGGPPPTVGNVAWGPDFGNPPEWEIGARVALTALALTHDKTVGCQVTMPALAVLGNVSCACDVAQPSLALAHSKSVGCDITALQYTVTGMDAVKDVDVDATVGCVGVGPANGTTIVVRGVAASKRDGFIGFDVSGMPSGASLVSATFSIGTVTPPLVVDQSIVINATDEADEGWTEAGITCANSPGLVGVLNTFVVENSSTGGGAPGDLDTVDVAAWTQLTNRFGVGTATLNLTNNLATGEEVILASRTNGTVASRPQLTFTFSVPT